MTLRLAALVDGNPAGETIVFVQGWPDDASLWDGAVAALRDTYRCVRTTLPNYGGDRTVRWGFSTAEILQALESFIEDAHGGKPVTLVLHDWGCYWGHAVHRRRPDLVVRIASAPTSLRISSPRRAPCSGSSPTSGGSSERSRSVDPSATG